MEIVGCVVDSIFELDASKRFSLVVQIMKFVKFRAKIDFLIFSILNGHGSVMSYVCDILIVCARNCSLRVAWRICPWQRRALRVFRAEARLMVTARCKLGKTYL